MNKLFSIIMVLMLGLSFAACSKDDGDKNESQLLGTWTRLVQWAGTNGTRDHSYTFKKMVKVFKKCGTGWIRNTSIGISNGVPIRLQSHLIWKKQKIMVEETVSDITISHQIA